jgi:hypothetical protein
MSTPERDSPDHLLADLDGIRSLLDDEQAAATRAADGELRAPDAALDAGTLTERLIERGLAAAIEARIDATLTHFINDTLQIEFALLRARLQDAIRNDIESFVSEEIRRTSRAGTDHGQNEHGQ